MVEKKINNLKNNLDDLRKRGKKLKTRISDKPSQPKIL